MYFRRTLFLMLPLLLSSAVALAQEAPASSPCPPCATTAPKTTSATKTKKTTTKAPAQTKAKKTTTKVENKDSDLDMSVSQTTTTSAEQPPHRDVVEEVREREGNRWSAAPLFGYGTADLKFGMGARGGYTFETPVYVGGTFLYHFGNDTNVDRGSGVTDTGQRFYYPAVEVGYDIGVGPLLVRPYGAVGILFKRTSYTASGVADTVTDNQLMVYPGVTAEYIFPHSPVFMGGDMRILLPLEGEIASFAIFATAGLTL